MNTAYWILLVLGLFAAFWALAWALNTLEDRIQRALTEMEPGVDDVTERRRLHAIVEWRR